MIYAPIIIITLDRFAHLKRCIESLKKNRYADNTELYISLDYPPSEKYQDGYNKIVRYLEAGISGFKKVNIFRQKSNLGPKDNFLFLIDKAFEKYDRVVVMEDDNEVSPIFLEYINYLLTKYENDESIFAIDGYSYPIEWVEDGADLVKADNMFSACGAAWWRTKYMKLIEEIKDEKMKQLMNSFWKVFSVYINNPACFGNLISSYLGENGVMCGKGGEFLPTDAMVVVYMITHKKYVIMPKVTQVVNHGMDGTGVNCTKNEKQRTQNNEIVTNWNKQAAINMDKSVAVHKNNHKKLAYMLPCSFRNICSSWVQYLMYRSYLKLPLNRRR